MLVFKPTTLGLKVGEVGLGLEPDGVELAGEWVEWAERWNVKQQCISPPELTLERAL